MGTFLVFFVIVGVWTQSNLLIYLNSDLTFRVHEISIYWDSKDLISVLDKGCDTLNN